MPKRCRNCEEHPWIHCSATFAGQFYLAHECDDGCYDVNMYFVSFDEAVKFWDERFGDDS